MSRRPADDEFYLDEQIGWEGWSGASNSEQKRARYRCEVYACPVHKAWLWPQESSLCVCGFRMVEDL